MPLRVSRPQYMSLTSHQLDWQPSREETSNLAASLTSLEVHGSRVPHKLESLKALLALRSLDFDFDLHTESLDTLTSLVRLLSDQLLTELLHCSWCLPFSSNSLTTAVLAVLLT